jgi:4-hydroxy-3-methylbut-2-enyl diphosphate reductase
MSDYYQKGFGLKAEVKESLLKDFYYDGIIRHIKEHGFVLSRGGLSLHMAKEMGFCYGVDRTVQYAYETKARFPDGRIYITDEVIHNPYVNEKLISLGMKFINGKFSCGIAYDDLRRGDVVIIPAFGVTVSDLQKLRERGVLLVDTTCGSVLNVWKSVERYAREGITAIVHGKYRHEETRATTSQVSKYPDARYLVVKDMAEARYVCDYIRRGGDAAEFKRRFERAMTPGFEPDRDLKRVGVANQTTMLSSESLEIEKALRQAMVDRYGESEVDAHFAAFDTICTATQDRQDAVKEMLSTKRLDLLLVVGGFNSSNTGHLAEMGAQSGVPTYHIENDQGMISKELIRHRDPHTGEVVTTSGWLPPGEATVGATAGASTPNNIVGQVIERLFELREIPLDDILKEGSKDGDGCDPAEQGRH